MNTMKAKLFAIASQALDKTRESTERIEITDLRIQERQLFLRSVGDVRGRVLTLSFIQDTDQHTVVEVYTSWRDEGDALTTIHWQHNEQCLEAMALVDEFFGRRGKPVAPNDLRCGDRIDFYGIRSDQEPEQSDVEVVRVASVDRKTGKKVQILILAGDDTPPIVLDGEEDIRLISRANPIEFATKGERNE